MKEVKITQYGTSVVVDYEHNQIAFNQDYVYRIEFADKAGSYMLEGLTFVGVQDGKLKFDNEEGETLHLEAKGIIQAWVFPKGHTFNSRSEEEVKEQNKVDLFNRYHELLINALRYEGITDEEREEMMLLHMEIKDDIPRLLNEAFDKKYKEVTNK